jgi:hypothetical protein
MVNADKSLGPSEPVENPEGRCEKMIGQGPSQADSVGDGEEIHCKVCGIRSEGDDCTRQRRRCARLSEGAQGDREYDEGEAQSCHESMEHMMMISSEITGQQTDDRFEIRKKRSEIYQKGYDEIHLMNIRSPVTQPLPDTHRCICAVGCIITAIMYGVQKKLTSIRRARRC